MITFDIVITRNIGTFQLCVQSNFNQFYNAHIFQYYGEYFYIAKDYIEFPWIMIETGFFLIFANIKIIPLIYIYIHMYI